MSKTFLKSFYNYSMTSNVGFQVILYRLGPNSTGSICCGFVEIAELDIEGLDVDKPDNDGTIVIFIQEMERWV